MARRRSTEYWRRVAAELSSVLEVSVALCRERYTLAGDPGARSVEIPRTHVRRVATGLVRVYDLAAKMLRGLVRTLYMFPILIVAKIILRLMNAPGGDLVTVGFVGLVVALFGMFSVVLLLTAIVGPRSKREDGLKLVFHAPTKRERDRIAANMLPDPGVHVVGRVDAGLAPGTTVLAEHWGDDHGKLVRFFEASSFVVVPDQDAPVVVELAACPVVLAPYDRGQEHVAVPGVGAVTPLGSFVLRQGERVEILASRGHPGTHPVLHESAMTPYRETEATATVVSSTEADPVVIRGLERA
jgi:hypothetical protein